MNNHLFRLGIISILVFANSVINAQISDTLDIQRNPNGKIKFARFAENENPHRSMHNDTVFLKTVLQAKNEDNFKKVKEFTDELGITHRRFQQFYKGLKVENAEYLVHGRNNSITLINGDFQDINVSSVNPSINETDALR